LFTIRIVNKTNRNNVFFFLHRFFINSCGTTAEYCGTGYNGNTGGNGNCAGGCPAGNCCSRFGFCGNTPEHCGTAQIGQAGQAGQVGQIGHGNCQLTGCPAGQCCSSAGLYVKNLKINSKISFYFSIF